MRGSPFEAIDDACARCPDLPEDVLKGLPILTPHCDVGKRPFARVQAVVSAHHIGHARRNGLILLRRAVDRAEMVAEFVRQGFGHLQLGCIAHSDALLSSGCTSRCPDQEQLIFGRRVTKRTPGRFHTRVITDRVSPMIVGYARISTEDQTLAPQLDALTSAGCEHTFTDTLSGAMSSEPCLSLSGI